MHRTLGSLILVAILMFTSCRKPAYHTDISQVDLELEIKRFDQELFGLDFDSIEARIPYFYERYGEFFDLFNYQIIRIGGARQVTYPDYLTTFLTDYLNNQVYQRTQEVFPDLDELEEILTEAFKRYRVHFPGGTVPDLIAFVSRFNESIVTAEGILGIGLDRYLGADTEYYRQLGEYQYRIRNMHPDQIPVDVMMGWGMTEFPFNDSMDHVLGHIIWNGKMACFTKWMLPGTPDSLIMGFTADQLEFCRNNEARMWEYLVEHKVLFETDQFTIQKYTGAGPFTSDFTPASPARAAVWIGWQIVEDYMHHQGAGLSDMMKENDYQQILTRSKYNPR